MQLHVTKKGVWAFYCWNYKHQSVQEKRAVSWLFENAQAYGSLMALARNLKDFLGKFNDHPTIEVKVQPYGSYLKSGYISKHQLFIFHKRTKRRVLTIRTPTYSHKEAKGYSDGTINPYLHEK